MSCLENIPLKIAYETFSKIVQEKNIIFYTGAGLSAAQDLTMKDLREAIYFVIEFRKN